MRGQAFCTELSTNFRGERRNFGWIGHLTLSAEPFPRANQRGRQRDESHVARYTATTGRGSNGEKPATLPVIVSSRFEMVLNMTTAQELGLASPLAACPGRRGD